MFPSIKCALFIDDDKATNYINQFLAKRSNYFENVVVVTSAEEGLEYLKKAENGITITPDIIFLDINMPAMNGWDFLNTLKSCNCNIVNDLKIYMLTSSSREKDIREAKKHPTVNGFLTKPLTSDALKNLVTNKSFFQLN